MKKFFAFVAAMLFAGSMMATDVLSIDFTQGQGDWTINNVSNPDNLTAIWAQNATYGMKATAYTSSDRVNHESESWLISPVVDLSSSTAATLVFSHARRYGELSQLTVMATSNGSQWTNLLVSEWPDGSNWNYIDATADLTAFAGQATVQIAFVYASSSTAAATWEIKTVAVSDSGEEPVEPVIEAISVAEAITTTMALPDSTTSADEYVVEGYVVNAGDFSWGSKQQIFWLADDSANTANQQFEAYYCTAMEDNVAMPVLNGDKVQLKGKLTKYVKDGNVTPEIKNGIATFISKVDGDRSQPVGDQITVAQALTYGANVAVGTTSTETYTIVGYVTAYDGKNEDGGWEQYGNQIFWIADTQGSTAKSNSDGGFEVYQGVSAEKVNIGDKVSVVTKIKNYNGLLESEQRAPVTILEKAGEEEEDADVVFTSEEFNGQGTSGTGGNVTATKDGVTFTCDKGFGDQYGVRCYKNSNVSITSAEQQIGKIVFEFATVSGKTYDGGGMASEIVVNGMEWTNTMSDQARMNKIKIYFGEYEQPQPEALDTISVAQAMEIGNALEAGAYTDKKYVVEGYAVSIKPYGDKYDGKQTFYMSDDATAERGDFTAFNCSVAAPGVEVGNFVRVTGKIQKYAYQSGDTVIEITGGDVEVVEGQGIENVVLTEKAQKVVVDGVIYIIRDNKLYNLQGAQVR